MASVSSRVFVNGNSQAVRIPQEFRLDTDRVEIFRDGCLPSAAAAAWCLRRTWRKRRFFRGHMPGHDSVSRLALIHPPGMTDKYGLLASTRWSGELRDEVCDGEQLEVFAEVRIVLMLTLYLLCPHGVEESHLSVQNVDA